MIDRRPVAVLGCRSAADVVAGVAWARREGLELAVKSGGHSVAGNGVCDGGVVLDVSGMKAVDVDPQAGVARVEAGVTLGELDAATATHRMATPTGVVSVTGLAGLALGGGLGWLHGRYGLACDNLLAAEVVTAAGELVTATTTGHADLHWALRGGGGNFGVVTAFTFRLHPVDVVQAGVLGFGPDRAAEALVAYHRLASSCPDELTVNASLYRDEHGEPGVALAWCHLGSPAEPGRLLAEVRGLGPDVDEAGPTRYLDLQRSSDSGFPEGRRHYWRSASLSAIDAECATTLLEQAAAIVSPFTGIGLQQLHGAAARVPAAATAYPHRSNRYDLLILSQWDEPADDEANTSWTNRCFTALERFTDDGVYVNNLGDEGEQRVRRAYGANFQRLRRVKARYDPDNVFRHNHNIPPA
ncbi:MAG: FAD-binding oxidoreductase [Acidimicrobiales bacterium]